MSRKTKRLFLVLGVISLIFGISLTIPSFLQRIYWGMGIGALLVIVGVILFSITYGN